jgi:chromosome partitioning protein
MIIAIVNQNTNPDRTIVACNLAVLRARSGRKVCILDTDSRRRGQTWSAARSKAGLRPWISGRAISSRGLQQDLAHLQPLFNDILIDAGTRDTPECRCALIAARLVLVPVHVDEVDLASQYALIARLNAARIFNPGLRVKFIMVSEHDDPSDEERAAVRAYVSRVMSATLASTVLHEPAANDYGSGRCVCDAETCDPQLVAEMRALYDEVYAPPQAMAANLYDYAIQGAPLQR